MTGSLQPTGSHLRWSDLPEKHACVGGWFVPFKDLDGGKVRNYYVQEHFENARSPLPNKYIVWNCSGSSYAPVPESIKGFHAEAEDLDRAARSIMFPKAFLLGPERILLGTYDYSFYPEDLE